MVDVFEGTVFKMKKRESASNMLSPWARPVSATVRPGPLVHGNENWDKRTGLRKTDLGNYAPLLGRNEQKTRRNCVNAVRDVLRMQDKRYK